MHVLLRTARLLLAASTIWATACSSNDNEVGENLPPSGFTTQNLLSDQVGVASHLDPSLVNAWGLAMDSTSFWIANNATGKVLVVAPDGSPSKVSPPASALDIGPGITGIVANTMNAFMIGTPSHSGPALMLVASETGQIFGINASIASTPQLVVDRTSQHASYKGLAVYAARDGSPRLAAADFHNARIDVFDGNFQLLASVVFTGPNLAAGLAPWNIVSIGTTLYVMYAVQDADRMDEVAGVGNGRIDAFDVDGNFAFTVLDGDSLNAPWGLAVASAAFAPGLDGTLIAGNFGDGTLIAINPRNGQHAQLRTADGSLLVIPGLWGLQFGDGVNVGALNSLYFASGPGDETHGLFGRIFMSVATPQ